MHIRDLLVLLPCSPMIYGLIHAHIRWLHSFWSRLSHGIICNKNCQCNSGPNAALQTAAHLVLPPCSDIDTTMFQTGGANTQQLLPKRNITRCYSNSRPTPTCHIFSSTSFTACCILRLLKNLALLLHTCVTQQTAAYHSQKQANTQKNVPT